MASESGYWSDRSLVITVNGPDGSSSVCIAKPFARVGSHKSSEIVLPKDIPSRWLYFHASQEGVFWIKLSPSAAGDRNTQGWLDPGQTLALGTYRIGARLEGDPVGRLPGDWTEQGTVEAPYPTMLIADTDRGAYRQPLTRRLTVIGRRKPSHIRLADHSVSRSHCVLYWDLGRMWVIDLLSGNGTKLSGEPVDATFLRKGTCLELGSARLCLEGQPDRQGAAKPDPPVLRQGRDEKREADLAARLSQQRQELASLRKQLEEQQVALQDRQEALEQTVAEAIEKLAAERRKWETVQAKPAFQLGDALSSYACNIHSPGPEITKARDLTAPGRVNGHSVDQGHIMQAANGTADGDAVADQDLLGAIAVFHSRKQLSHRIRATLLGFLGRSDA
jgi:hypothetical protein